MFARGLLTLAVLVVAGCGLVVPLDPTPVVRLTEGRAAAAISARFATTLAAFDARRMRYAAGLRPDAPVPPWLARRLEPVAAQAAAMDGGRIAPVAGLSPGRIVWDDRWREARAFLYIGDSAPAADVPFRVADRNAHRSVVHLRSLATATARITAVCDGDVEVTVDGSTGRRVADAPFDVTLPAGARDTVVLRMGPAVQSCTLTVRVGRAAPHVRTLVRETGADPVIDALDSAAEVCAAPAAGSDALATAFLTDRWLSQTCAMPLGTARLLPDSRDGFNAKVAALTGDRLSDAAFDAGNPEVPLDFSNAPDLDLIYLSYLDLKADFSGAIIARALRHHAARGTLIRILVTDVLELEKDRALYEGLAAEFPNVQLQLFSWEPPRFAPYEELFAALHRVHHVKMFATIGPDPDSTRAIIGGRNIHDGFLFNAALDLSAFPSLQDYGEPGELSLAYFSTYHDFEVELSAPATVRRLAAHLSTFWHRDFDTTMFRPMTVTGAAGAPAPQQGLRHFISVPYLDGRALESYWIDLIDSATRSVEIVTPYLNPTPAIEAALLRADARGVEVTIVARIELYGDLGGRLMTEMNMLFVERHAARFTIWEYDPPDVVLHTKMLLIDGRLSVLSSVNLNRRSFLHDTENGIAVLDPAFYARVRQVVQGYIDSAVRLTPADTDIRPISRTLFASDGVRDVF